MKKPRKNLWPPLYGLVLTLFTAYVLLDAFVIPRSFASVKNSSAESSSSESASESGTGDGNTEAVVTDSSYNDGEISIQITTYREYNTTIYVADVTLSSIDALQTAFANNTYGKNITQTVSDIAESSGAILAINGDYYSARNGYVIRNGVLYRETSSGSDQQDLVIGADGSFSLITEGAVTAQELLSEGAQQVLSFGPGLVENGEVIVSADAEVDQAKNSNPRTAIGMISPLHYVFVVADGRTSASAGLSLQELAEFMQGLGVQTGYNLDGGGSATMVFNGTVINQPTTNGKKITERKVSDIVCIG